MLKKCIECEKEIDTDGDFCPYCREMVFPVVATEKTAKVYLHNDYSFGEICDESQNLTIEQIKALYNALYEVCLIATFDKNEITSLEVCHND